jgi:sugar/nucleoside kinase (ribokinase family)
MKIRSVPFPISFITPNLAEYIGLIGQGTPGSPDMQVRTETKDGPGGLEELKRTLPHVCAAVITLGAGGSILMDARAGTLLRVPSIPVTVVDPNGAGDAFVAGFVAGLLRGESPGRAMACGAAAASLTLASAESVDHGITMARVLDLAARVRNPEKGPVAPTGPMR